MKETKENKKYIVISARETGLKHIRTFSPCQDSTASKVNNEFAALAVADGHGHKMHYLSETGSRLACASALEVLREIAADGCQLKKIDAFSRRLIGKRIYERWKEKVLDDFSLRCSPVSEQAQSYVFSIYGTTLLYALAFDNGIFIGQIGDGAVVVRDKTGSISTPLLEERTSECPDSLCDDDAGRLFRTVFLDAKKTHSLLLCSDGIVNHYGKGEDFFDYADSCMKTRTLDLPKDTLDDASAVALWLL